MPVVNRRFIRSADRRIAVRGFLAESRFNVPGVRGAHLAAEMREE